MAALARPDDRQLEWADAELGLFFHYDIEVFQPELSPHTDGEVRLPAADRFNPAELDTDQWLRTAVDAGARYALLTAKHSTGFCLWPTKQYDYSVKSAPWRGGRGDVVRDFVTSCHKYGVRPGLYYSTQRNAFLGTRTGLFESAEEQQHYNAVVLGHLEELLSDYGELFEIWFDGGVITTHSGGPDIVPLLHRLQPRIIAFDGPQLHQRLLRWSGSEQGVSEQECFSTSNYFRANEHIVRVRPEGQPDGAVWAPVEVDMPSRDLLRAYMQGWMWHEGEEELVYESEYLFARYCTSVGRNSNLLIGAVPDRRGLVPDRDAGELARFAALVRARFGEPLGVASGSGWEVKVALPGRCDVERVVIMEAQSGGQRIREWVLEGLWPESWGEGWFELARGRAIGHKRIVELRVIRLAGLRLRVREAAGTPVIRSLAVHGSRVDR